MRSLLRIERRATRLGHHHEWTHEKLWIGERHDDVHRIAFGILRDTRLRELGQADREVLVRPGVVDVPAVAVSLGRRPETHPAEAKAAVVRAGWDVTHGWGSELLATR